MKRALLLLSVTGLFASLSSCAHPPRIQWVHTGTVLQSSPGVTGPLYMINGVALQQYSPKLYTPFQYDHRSMADNSFYQAQALRHSARKGSVHMGPLTWQAAENAAPTSHPYEVRRAGMVMSSTKGMH
ncbi:hypothetical protein [Prosthecobacter fluviatilis]|uniref:Uncharacterized protein n=1 Tax=Prosthecobacter fluviatilis TaxID=445931 RepID=A0ABW0KLU8_9BACT